MEQSSIKRAQSARVLKVLSLACDASMHSPERRRMSPPHAGNALVRPGRPRRARVLVFSVLHSCVTRAQLHCSSASETYWTQAGKALPCHTVHSAGPEASGAAVASNAHSPQWAGCEVVCATQLSNITRPAPLRQVRYTLCHVGNTQARTGPAVLAQRATTHSVQQRLLLQNRTCLLLGWVAALQAARAGTQLVQPCKQARNAVSKARACTPTGTANMHCHTPARRVAARHASGCWTTKPRHSLVRREESVCKCLADPRQTPSMFWWRAPYKDVNVSLLAALLTLNT